MQDPGFCANSKQCGGPPSRRMVSRITRVAIRVIDLWVTVDACRAAILRFWLYYAEVWTCVQCDNAMRRVENAYPTPGLHSTQDWIFPVGRFSFSVD